MELRMVTLSGTWTRSNTESWDLSLARRKSYLLRQREGVVNTPRVFALTLTAKQAGKGREPKDREGTFLVQVAVPNPRSNTGTGGMRRQAIARAKVITRWWMQDMFCRGPKLTYDPEKCWVSTRAVWDD